MAGQYSKESLATLAETPAVSFRFFQVELGEPS